MVETIPASRDEAVPSSGVASPNEIEAAREKVNEKETDPKTQLKRWQWILSLIGLYLGALLYGLDTTIAADVQSSVYDTFSEIQNLPWIGIGFPMASVAVILSVGRFYGLFNIKVLMLSSIALFEGGSALCGGAPSSSALIVGRVIAGIGGAGMYLGALNYISVFGSVRLLPLYNALIGLSWGVGAILGPVIGGAFSTSSATWRWAFYINLPLAALLSPVYFFVFPSWSPAPERSVLSKLKEFDWLGAVLNGATFVLIMIALIFSGSTYPWNSGAAISIWVVFGVVLIAFILQQYFCILTTAENRIFPVHLLKSRDLVLLYICTACAAAAMSTTLYYIPLWFAFTRGDSALEQAVRLLPYIIVFIFAVMVAGGSLPVVGRYAPYYTVGGCLTLTGSALLFAKTSNPELSIGSVYGFEVLIAIGTGLTFQNAYAVAAAKVDEKDKANAIGFINVSQIGTIALALSIAASLFENLGFQYLKHALRDFNLPDAFFSSALAGVDSAILKGASPEVQKIVFETVAHTVSRIFAIGTSASALMICASLFLRQEKLDLTNPGA